MGHRKQRKRARRATKGWDDNAFLSLTPAEPWFDPEPSAPWQWQDALGDAPREAVKTCGSCQEFVAEMENGRGECLHPGSGILSPWSDTAACPFFTATRHMTRAGGRR